MRTLWNDVYHGVRVLTRSPGIIVVATLVLALGVGANGAIFSFARSLLLSRPNLPEPQRLVRVYSNIQNGSRFETFSFPEYRELRNRSRSFDGLAAHSLITVSLGTEESAEILRGEIVSGNYFSVLGLQSALGRTLLDSDDQVVSAHPVVVISDRLWKTRFGADPEVLGRTIFLNTHAFEIIGVAPRHFQGSYDAFASDLWAPLAMYEEVRPRGISRERWGWGWLKATGRLAPGISLEKAQEGLAAVAASIRVDHPEQAAGLFVTVLEASSIPEEFRDGLRGALTFFTAIVGLVLLVATANVAGLLLSKMTSRGREIAVRKSMGASRSRLARQFLTESLLLAVLGGLAALPVTLWSQRALLSLRPPIDEFARFSPSLQLDWPVIGFTFLVALLTGMLFGLVPALYATKGEIAASLKEDAGSFSRSRYRTRWQGGLVVAQVCMSLVLITAAGLLVRDLFEAKSLDTGFNSDGLLLAEINLRTHNYDEPRGRVFFDELVKRLESEPGVTGATLASVVPLGGSRDRQGVQIPGHAPPERRSTIPVDFSLVGPDYFQTMGIPLLEGRDLPTDILAAEPQPFIVVNETMANRYWGDETAVGKRIRFGPGGPEAEIAGVVADVKYYSLAEESLPFMYLPFSQVYSSVMTVHVQVAGEYSEQRSLLRGVLKAVDPKVAPSSLLTFAELREIPLFLNRAIAALSAAFGILTLVLTAVGIYGMVAYTVSHRAREIGIRIALGADRRNVFRLIVHSGMGLVSIGIVSGLILAAISTHLMGSLLTLVDPLDLLTFTLTAGFSFAVALIACLIPSMRASRIDPIETLRCE